MISVGVQIGLVLSTGSTRGACFHCIISITPTLVRDGRKLPEGIQERQTNA